MRDTIFNAIVGFLQASDKFKGEDGTGRVYDWSPTDPSGYPYAVVGSESLESNVLDNARDARLYNFKIYIVGEKFGEPGGLTQSVALQNMRQVEDAVLSILDTHNTLGTSFVIRTMPTAGSYGYTDAGSRVVLTLHVQVDTTVSITL